MGLYRVRPRLRRLRRSPSIRAIVRETDLSSNNLMAPIFIKEGIEKAEPIESMPGVFRYPVNGLDEIIGEMVRSGVMSFLLFGVPQQKDEVGSRAYSNDNIIVKSVEKIKNEYPAVTVATDVCLCGYTSHGHCGLVRNGVVDNDATLPLLAKAAVSYANAGADIVAPSAMMDHQVYAIRNALDDAGLKDSLIMSYSAKFASCFYGPFREAANSKPAYGDRSEYQLDFCNPKQAMREIQADVDEGADIIMVKPALAYLDIIYRAAQSFDLPLAAYNVSGEYSMIKAAASNGWIDESKAMIETALAIRRAGADIIITYYAKQLAESIRGDK